MLGNCRGSIDGKGCRATSVLEDPDRPNVAYVFEVFVDQAAYDAHHAAPYFAKFIDETTLMLAEPMERLPYNAFPGPAAFEHLRLAVPAPSPS